MKTEPPNVQQQTRLPAGPYDGIPIVELSRLSADLSWADKRTISSFCAVLGIHNRITQILYHHIASECQAWIKLHKSATLEEREQFLFDLVRRTTAVKHTPSEPNANDAGRTPDSHSEATGSSNVKTSTAQNSGGGSRRKTKKAKEGIEFSRAEGESNGLGGQVS